MLLDACADLLLGSACVGCGRPGRALCRACRAELPATASVRWPWPTPAGLAPPYSCGPYDGLLRSMVLAHKERRALALTRPLGEVLAAAVAAALAPPARPASAAEPVPVVLVPVPSRRSAVRARGHDPTAAMTRAAARTLRGPDRPVVVARLLRLRGPVTDQAGLGAAARAANLSGSMACPADAVRRLADRVPRAHVVVCDDVLTTGATAREAQRALEAAGVPVLSVATVAATVRRHPPGEFPKSSA